MPKKKMGPRLNTMQIHAIKRLAVLVGDRTDDVGTNEAGAVRDIMTDLRHYCENTKIDFQERLDASYQVYLEEKRG